MKAEAAWQDCRERRGTSASDEVEALLKAYFMEGYSYAAESPDTEQGASK